MARIIVRAGYDFVGKFTFYLDGVVEDLSSATLIECSLKNEAKTSELITDTAQSSVATGADWANGVVVISFPLASTGSLTAQNGFIEVAVVKGGVRLPYEDIPVVIEVGWTL